MAVCVFGMFHMEKWNVEIKPLILLVALNVVTLLFFSHLFYAISLVPEKGFSTERFMQNFLFGGKVFYGGLFGIFIGLMLGPKVSPRSRRERLDYFAPAIPLYHCIARIGCLLSGCCYGLEWKYGISNYKFPGVKLFPIQLVESLCNLFLFLFLLYLQKKRKTDRYSLEIYIVLYGILRYILEFFRGDEVRGIWKNGLSTSQNLSLILIGIVCMEFLYLGMKKNKGGYDEA